MNKLKRTGLQIDDPLAPSHPATEDAQPAKSAPQTQPVRTGDTGTSKQAPRSQPKRPSQPASSSQPESRTSAVTGPSEAGIWRAWSGITGVGSFRLPHELLVELGATARELQLPIGLIVTAAITQLLDQPPETIAALVEHADDARIHGRRRSRRRLTTPSDD